MGSRSQKETNVEAPVFLVAAERSGTTLLRTMLDSHPQIAWPSEFDYALDWPAEQGAEWPDLVDFWSRLAESRAVRQARIRIDPALRFPALVRSLYDQHRSRTRERIVGVTAHRHFERLLRLWPDASFIYLLRDGRDVARSWVENGAAGNVWTASQEWLAAERSWRAVAAQVPAERKLEVRFEALVTAPERELARICAFLGVEESRDMLDYPARTSHEPPDPRLVERWRLRLSRREVALLEASLGAALRERGYAVGAPRPAWVPAPRRLALRAGDRVARGVARVRRDGLRRWLQRQAGRRIGLGSLRGALSARMRWLAASATK
jgi:hypothetical protein